MMGVVDDYGRALLPITVRDPLTQSFVELQAWIDTGFAGTLMLPADTIAALALPKSGSVSGSLADGSLISFDTFDCVVDWMGVQRPVTALGSAGRFPLIGVGLLEDCTVTIDYPARTVTVAHNSV